MKTVKISELTPDNLNANKGTQRGAGMLEKSLRDYGAGRSVLVDKAGRIIAGNKTIEAAGAIGLEDAVMVETDGSQVVIVKRTDLDIDSPEGRGLAIADNRVAEVGLDWDIEALEKIGEELDLGEFWFADELPEIDFGSIDGDHTDGLERSIDSTGETDLLMNAKRDAWKEWCGDRVLQIEALNTVGFTDSGLSQASAVILFTESLMYGNEYPRYASVAFHPQQIHTKGDNYSVVEGLKRVSSGQINPDRAEFAFKKPLNRRLISGTLPFGGSRMPPDFPASLARNLIDEFTPPGGSVLDPCHGWGGRLVGFLLSKAALYHGNDVSDLQSKGVKAIRDRFLPLVDGKSVTLDCERFQSLTIDSGAYDLVITSPPYYDTECYVGGDQSHESSSYESWVADFYKPTILKIFDALKDSGIACLQVGSQRYPLAMDGIRLAAAVGLIHVETRETSIIRTGKDCDLESDEVVLIFRKPSRFVSQ